jgi:endo-1,4-beta-D-glucanase Y
MDDNAASDGETFIVTSLLFADARWGSAGRINYRGEAELIMHAMLHKEDGPEKNSVTNMFDNTTHQVVFVPYASAATYTDPSYHTPAFYVLWGLVNTTCCKQLFIHACAMLCSLPTRVMPFGTTLRQPPGPTSKQPSIRQQA